MAYQIHIVPGEKFHGEEAWRLAVEATDGVRLANSDENVATNPKTGEEIRIGGSCSDAEIYFPDEDEWHRALHWRGGRASINARFEIGDEDDPAWMAVKHLAERLGATVMGDEGEIYELG